MMCQDVYLSLCTVLLAAVLYTEQRVISITKYSQYFLPDATQLNCLLNNYFPPSFFFLCWECVCRTVLKKELHTRKCTILRILTDLIYGFLPSMFSTILCCIIIQENMAGQGSGEKIKCKLRRFRN